jgi:hypothetical protein
VFVVVDAERVIDDPHTDAAERQGDGAEHNAGPAGPA